MVVCFMARTYMASVITEENLDSKPSETSSSRRLHAAFSRDQISTGNYKQTVKTHDKDKEEQIASGADQYDSLTGRLGCDAL
jgi:hypothetical protein